MKKSFLKHSLKFKGNLLKVQDTAKVKFLFLFFTLLDNKTFMNKKKKLFTLLSSPFVHKKSRKQFYFHRFVFSIIFRVFLKADNLKVLNKTLANKSVSLNTTYRI